MGSGGGASPSCFSNSRQWRSSKRSRPATLALAGDTDALHKNGNLIPKDWQKRLPHNSSPYTSTNKTAQAIKRRQQEEEAIILALLGIQ